MTIDKRIEKKSIKLMFNVVKRAYKMGKHAFVKLKNDDIVICPSYKAFKIVYKNTTVDSIFLK